MESQFAQIIKAPGAQERAFAVLMIDVDHFKQINDTYGHAVGDDVLRNVATRCRTALLEDDLFARFRGEEFVALLAAPQAAALTAIAERVRKSIAETAFVSGALSVPPCQPRRRLRHDANAVPGSLPSMPTAHYTPRSNRAAIASCPTLPYPPPGPAS